MDSMVIKWLGQMSIFQAEIGFPNLVINAARLLQSQSKCRIIILEKLHKIAVHNMVIASA